MSAPGSVSPNPAEPVLAYGETHALPPTELHNFVQSLVGNTRAAYLDRSRVPLAANSPSETTDRAKLQAWLVDPTASHASVELFRGRFGPRDLDEPGGQDRSINEHQAYAATVEGLTGIHLGYDTAASSTTGFDPSLGTSAPVEVHDADAITASMGDPSIQRFAVYDTDQDNTTWRYYVRSPQNPQIWVSFSNGMRYRNDDQKYTLPSPDQKKLRDYDLSAAATVTLHTAPSEAEALLARDRHQAAWTAARRAARGSRTADTVILGPTRDGQTMIDPDLPEPRAGKTTYPIGVAQMPDPAEVAVRALQDAANERRPG